MTDWIRLTVPTVAVISMATSAYATQYMTVDEARKNAFPSASFAEVQSGRVWKAQSGGRVVGFFFFDHVIGKHLYIDYTVALDPEGKVRRVDILQYRESYGGEVRDSGWLGQFVGKSSHSSLQINSDIRNISGATLSSTHLTEGVKRVLAYYASSLK
jgi:Na+-translocating ferredoxin:NAD+ oxidoreductase RnfG subunit